MVFSIQNKNFNRLFSKDLCFLFVSLALNQKRLTSRRTAAGASKAQFYIESMALKLKNTSWDASKNTYYNF